ncbi:MAG: hypothetical protein UW63_C0038G0012 [Candidatus Uhrbacteria bacterium GW2011_GWF2_44_350]|uniref:Uncharacterized protein n=1 Tax=Candidatus Uhrbacteria bacterium GW2011_GWF2_44_350 TaxID=1619000 RepID=A0A0G1JEH4_9BACT|nr:MAG: hypothetical protein UW63_C0038G0012 [Candidatus Uhrbacteria bacterium GW2011_GWF2_44_350]HBR80405.1 hypothetical protein [Candidatus Uhrbacteria bacterium]
MKTHARHLSRGALVPTEPFSHHGEPLVYGGAFSYTPTISPVEQLRLADDSAGRAIAEAVALAVSTPPRSAYRADDPLGFPWSTVELLPVEE